MFERVAELRKEFLAQHLEVDSNEADDDYFNVNAQPPPSIPESCRGAQRKPSWNKSRNSRRGY